MPKFDLSKIEGFEWDEGNVAKNWLKHKVSKDECEKIFLNEPLRFFDDEIHSKAEKRYGVLGKTNQGRVLTVFFAVRSSKIRVISAHDQGKKDRKIYNVVVKNFNRRQNEKPN